MKANLFFPLATLVAFLGSAVDMAFSAADPEQTNRGIRYACAGVGDDSRHDPRWPGYAAKLVFAGATGDFLGDVRLSIGDSAGGTMFEAHCLSPWIFVDLPPGKYRAEAVARLSYSKTFDLSVRSRGQTEQIVRFPEIMN